MASSSQSTVNSETSKPTIQNVVDRLTKSQNLLMDANMLDSSKKLIAGLKDIEQFLVKPEHNIVVEARLKTVLERIHIPFNDLETYDGQKSALPAEQLQAEFDTLNEIVSKLMSQLTINPETSKLTIQNLVDSLTKSENFLKDVNMLHSLKKLIAGLKGIEQFYKQFFTESGHNTVVGARVKTVLKRIHILSINLGTYDDQEFAMQAVQLQAELETLNVIVSKLMPQLRVNKEISKPIIPNLVDRLTKVEDLLNTKKVKGCDKANMLEHLKKFIANLNDIKEFFKNYGHDTAEGAQVKKVLARILDGLPINLETTYGLICALRAVPKLKADFDQLNENIVSKLKLQSKILYLADQISTEAENLMNSKDNEARGVLVKTVLERIVPSKDLYDLGTDGNGKKVDDLRLMKAQLDELSQTITRLKQQAPLPAKSVPYELTTVSQISENIIPGVVTRLKLANMYSLSQKDQSAGAGEGADKGADTGKELKKLTNDLSYIRSFLKNMEDNSKSLSNRVKNFEGNATVFVNALIRHSDFQESLTELQDEQQGSQTEFQDQELKAKIRLLNKVVMKLKHQISSSNKLSLTDSDADWYKTVMNEFDHSQVLDILPVLHQDQKFKSSKAFGDFRRVYEKLNHTTKLCLLCFAAIPENEVVKKRFMTHWWFGEGFVSSLDDGSADPIFDELVKQNCIEPVDEKYKYVVDSYKMNPLIRSAVIVLAKEAQFFDFDAKEYPNAYCNKSYRACLGDGFDYGELFKSKIESSKMKSKNGSKRKNEGSSHGPDVENPEKLDAEKLQVIFNVNEPYPDAFELEWFSMLKNVKVLYLGRWQTSARHHIEVEGTDFLKGLKSMKLLRFLSLQGISRITKLPDEVCKLVNLMILDLRACHNLEAIPSRIGSLKNLTHLDISECYLVDSMPKGITSLSNLQVFKGFVVSDHHDSRASSNCSLEDLSKLEKLRKLSIYTNSEEFPKDLTTLVKFEVLQKLTITWGAGAFTHKATNTSSKNGGDNKRPEVAGTNKFPHEESGDGKKQDKVVPQPITTATTTTPKNSGDNKNQDKDVARQTAEKGAAAEPVATTTTSSKKAGDMKTEDVGGALPIAATAKSPEESEENKRQDRDAAQPIAATAKSPEESEEKKRQDRGAVQPITTTTTTLKNSGGNKNDQHNGVSQPMEGIIFEKLQKLDLKCYPRETPPRWLHPRNLPNLKKLYIRGGTLQNLSPDEWKNVEVLRLKFLSKLKMDYKKLRSSFPSLIYLENFKCPKLTYFPCNENGVMRLK